jgi:subfamily B ATP-binding cassette protein MsbA
MDLNANKEMSTLKIWSQQIKFWPSHFVLFTIAAIITIPLSLGLVSVTSVIIQTINFVPDDITWKRLIGEQFALWITPLVEGTQFEYSIPLTFQKDWFALIFITLSFTYCLLNFYCEYNLKYLGEKLAKKLRYDISNKYFSLNYLSAKNIDIGLLSSMVGEDIREAQQTFTRLINTIIKNGLTSIVLILWLVILDYQLFILFLTVLIPAGIVLKITSKTLKKLSRQGLQFESELLSSILERMRGWQTIQSHKAIVFEILKFNKINDKIYHVWRRATRAKSLGSPLVEWFSIIAGAFIIIAALRRISENTLDSSIFINFMITTALLSDKISKITDQLNSTKKGTEALQRIRNFITKDTFLREINKNTNTQINNYNINSINKIHFNNVSIGNTDNTQLVKNINLTINKGEILAIIGPSGVGKSTFIRTVLGLQKPLNGNIYINDQVITENLFYEISSKICFIPQDPFIFLGTIFDNIVYPQKIIKPTQEQIHLAKNALKLSLLDKDLMSNTSGLSGGEKQRLMFARIFYKTPHLIIIDEGTSALDLINETKIIKNLKEHVKNSITLVIAHRPAIKEYATNILDFSNSRASQTAL